MAERRMFTKKIIDSDDFISLSSSAQALYFHLNMAADDDGFNNQIQNAMFKSHSTADDFNILLAKRFIIRFESGVIVIRHWRMHNYIQNDRKSDTEYSNELSQLTLLKNKSYDIENGGVSKMYPECIQNVSKMYPQDRIGKDRIDKDSIGYNPPLPPLQKNETVLSTIENYTADEKIVALLKEFVELRQKKKKPLTVRAIKMALNELDKLSGEDADKKEAIINQTLLHAWDSFYDLKDNTDIYGKKRHTLAEQIKATEERLRQKGIVFE